MLFFGHIGITTGLVKVCQELSTRSKTGPNEIRLNSKSDTTPSSKPVIKNSIREKIKSIDYRFVLLGSLLPDIIDKPMTLFFGDNLNWSGRGYAHTFLFSFLLLIIGLVLVTHRNKIWLLTISLGCFIHLILDQMWLNTTALWWPLLGPIQRGVSTGWLSALWHGLISNPYDYLTEIIGFIIILYMTLRLIINRRVVHFLKTGDIDWNKSST